MKSQVELDIVIVNYNSGDMLIKCVDGLVSTKSLKINIIIVDNNSIDQSIENFEQSQVFDKAQIIKNSLNVGYAKACNQGASNGRSKLIAFINTDCFIQTTQLYNLGVALIKNPHAALIGCRVINEDGTLQAASRRRLPTFWRTVFHLTQLDRLPLIRGINIKDDGVFNDIQKVEAVNGACWIIKRKHFELIGGFDEAYPLHFEDLDIFKRLKDEGFELYYDSQISVMHLKGGSSKDAAQVEKWKRQGLLRYFSQHRPRWEFKAAQFILGLK